MQERKKCNSGFQTKGVFANIQKEFHCIGFSFACFTVVKFCTSRYALKEKKEYIECCWRGRHGICDVVCRWMVITFRKRYAETILKVMLFYAMLRDASLCFTKLWFTICFSLPCGKVHQHTSTLIVPHFVDLYIHTKKKDAASMECNILVLNVIPILEGVLLVVCMIMVIIAHSITRKCHKQMFLGANFRPYYCLFS